MKFHFHSPESAGLTGGCSGRTAGVPVEPAVSWERPGQGSSLKELRSGGGGRGAESAQKQMSWLGAQTPSARVVRRAP